MRHARAGDYRRRLVTKKARWKVGISRLSYEAVPTLGSLDLMITTPFTVLCGPNGVGKSTLLGTLRAALEGENFSPDAYFKRKATSGSATIEYSINGKQISNTVDIKNGEATLQSGASQSTVFINSGEAIPRLQTEFCAFDNRDDLLNGAGSVELTTDELAQVKYVLHRDYQRVVLSEVETSHFVPFFEVTHGDDQYDSRTMGAGELAALYVWWKIKTAEINSFVLIEEPEAFLSSATQEALGNFLVWQAYTKGLCMIVTSHSAPIVGPLPYECRRYIFRSGGNLKIADKPSVELLRKIGIRPTMRGMLFVEDHAAKTFTKLMLEHVDPLLASGLSIQVSGSDGEISAVLKSIGSIEGSLSVIGMYDGDMRVQVATSEFKNAMCLPGSDPIEVVFRSLVITSTEVVATHRGITKQKLEEVLYSAEGADHHDWYETVCNGVGLTKEQLMANLFVIWMREKSNSDAVGGWFAELYAMLSQNSH